MKRVSFNLQNHAHFLTFGCYRRQQFLTDETLCRHLLACWDDARRKGDFAIWAYVLMPEHVHLLVWPRGEPYRMASIMRLLKEPFARWAVKYWSSAAPHWLERIKVERGKRIVFRLWQEGGGYDRNLHNWESIAKAIEYIEWNPVRRGLAGSPAEWLWSIASRGRDRNDSRLVVDSIDEVVAW
jgi:putative transposase